MTTGILTDPRRRHGEASEVRSRLVRIVIAVLVFAAVTAGAIVWSVSRFDDARAERIDRASSDDIRVDSIYSDRIESRFDADYDRSRYRTMAERFASDPILVDEYQAWAVNDAELSTLRTELTGLDIPTYVAFLSLSELDDADGDARLVAARIARELPDEKATVLVLGGTGVDFAEKGIDRSLGVEYPQRTEKTTAVGLALDWVRALEATEIREPYTELEVVPEPREKQRPEDLAYHPGSAVAGAAFGLITGGGIAAVTVAIVRGIRSRKEDVAR